MMLKDDRILLRAPEPADVDGMYIIENDPALWADGVTFAPLSRKQLWDYVDSYDGNIFAAGQLRLVIESVDTGHMVGMVDLYDFDRVNRRAYVGITIAKAYRGKGLATRALKMLQDYCGTQLGLHQLAAVVRADNEPSIKLFARCGFTETGRFTAWIKRGTTWADAIHLQHHL